MWEKGRIEENNRTDTKRERGGGKEVQEGGDMGVPMADSC